MQLFSPGTALALHGLWGVQCAAAQLSNVHGEVGAPQAAKCPSASLPGRGRGCGAERGEFGCGGWEWGWG